MEIDKMEKWLNTTKTPQDVVYYRGHLVEDNTKENPEVQKLAKLFLNATGKNIVDLFQKKIKKAASLKLQAASGLTVNLGDDRMNLERGITWTMNN